jgi:hypothetical protein
MPRSGQPQELTREPVLSHQSAEAGGRSGTVTARPQIQATRLEWPRDAGALLPPSVVLKFAHETIFRRDEAEC